jgi:hypothetical protein
MSKRDEMFVPENKVENSEEVYDSPSKKYRLVVTSYKMGDNAWQYTKGDIFVLTEEGPVWLCDVRRNYGVFWHTWVEGHVSDSKDYLLCGESYIGYTVVDLARGTKKSTESVCWCPYGMTLSSCGRILVVDGCYWACGAQYFILDFSDLSRFGASGFPVVNHEHYCTEKTKIETSADGSFAWIEYEVFHPILQNYDDVLSSIWYHTGASGDKLYDPEKYKEMSKLMFGEPEIDADFVDSPLWEKRIKQRIVYRKGDNGAYAVAEAECELSDALKEERAWEQKARQFEEEQGAALFASHDVCAWLTATVGPVFGIEFKVFASRGERAPIDVPYELWIHAGTKCADGFLRRIDFAISGGSLLMLDQEYARSLEGCQLLLAELQKTKRHTSG